MTVSRRSVLRILALALPIFLSPLPASGQG
jgi:hypothetical protein